MRLRNSNTLLLVNRILAVYAVLALLRCAFWIYNFDTVGGPEPGELWHLAAGALRFDTVSVLYTNALFIVLSLIPLNIRFSTLWQKIMYWCYMITNTVMVVCLNIADIMYFHGTQKRLTADEVFFADNDNTARLILKFAAENWYLVLLGAALIWMLHACYLRRRMPVRCVRGTLAFHATGTAVLAAAAALAVGGIRGGFAHSTRPITLSNAADHTGSLTKSYLILSNPFCTLRTMGHHGIESLSFFPEEEIDSIYTPVHRPAERQDAPLRGKNIVVFILESFSAEHSAFLNPDVYRDREGYTPFLDSLMRSGLTFTRAYANGHKSIEAMPSILGSIPSMKTPFVLMPQSLGKSRQLPRILASQGYGTYFFFGSPKSSMGFGAYAVNSGISKIYAREEYERDRGEGDFDGWWGIWDEKMIRYMGDCLTEQAEEPFMSCIYTISSHHPFVYPKEYEGMFAQGETKLQYVVQYTDNAIRLFFEENRDKEWFGRTAFVFIADHVSPETFTPECQTLMGGNRIIYSIYAPDGSVSGQCGTVTQQIDLMPTLLGLMGCSEPYLAFGEDISSGQGGITFGFSSKALQYYIADSEYLVLFDGESITKVCLTDDITEQAIPEPWPERVGALADMLRARLQQYYSKLAGMDLTAR